MATPTKPKGRERETPGATGEIGFYHIEVRPKEDYKRFRAQDVGEKGGIERVGGQCEDGVWETVKWLVGKELEHVENGRLVADHRNAKELFDRLDSEPKHIEGNSFEAKDRASDC